MARATMIKLKSRVYFATNLLEIDEIYLENVKVPGFYKKDKVHDFIKKGNSVFVGDTYTKCIAKVSVNFEKYVSSTPNDSIHDNLLMLPVV